MYILLHNILIPGASGYPDGKRVLKSDASRALALLTVTIPGQQDNGDQFMMCVHRLSSSVNLGE